MNKKNFIKLARLVAKFAEVKTDKGILIFDGELAAGVEVTNEEGEAVEDGEYILEDGRTVVVAESKIVEIKELEDAAETPEETLEEALEEVTPEEPDPKDAEIEQLKAKIAEYEATIEQLNNKIKELEDAAEAPKEEPIAMSAVAQSHKSSGALKYFA